MCLEFWICRRIWAKQKKNDFAYLVINDTRTPRTYVFSHDRHPKVFVQNFRQLAARSLEPCICRPLLFALSLAPVVVVINHTQLCLSRCLNSECYSTLLPSPVAKRVLQKGSVYLGTAWADAARDRKKGGTTWGKMIFVHAWEGFLTSDIRRFCVLFKSTVLLTPPGRRSCVR